MGKSNRSADTAFENYFICYISFRSGVLLDSGPENIRFPIFSVLTNTEMLDYQSFSALNISLKISNFYRENSKSTEKEEIGHLIEGRRIEYKNIFSVSRGFL